MKINAWTYLSIILALILVFMQMCRHCPKCADATIVSDTAYVHDSFPKYIPVSTPVPYAVITTDTIPSNVDTIAILKDYFAKYLYSQTIADTSISVTISDTISQNKIAGRGFSYQILRPQQIITNTTIIADKKFKAYVGLGFTYANSAVGFAPHLLLQTKKDVIYGVGYDVVNKGVMGSAYFKIKLKKQ